MKRFETKWYLKWLKEICMLLLQKKGLKGLENFQASDRQSCGTGIRLDLGGPKRWNWEQLQGNPSKGELHNEKC